MIHKRFDCTYFAVEKQTRQRRGFRADFFLDFLGIGAYILNKQLEKFFLM